MALVPFVAPTDERSSAVPALSLQRAAELAVLARSQTWPAGLGTSHVAAGGQEGGAVLPSLISN